MSIPTGLAPDDLLAEVMGRNAQLHTPAEKAEITEAAVIESLVESCQEVMTKMFNITVTPAGVTSGCAESRAELSGVIGISGKARITVVVNVSEEFAFRVTESLTGLKPEKVDSDVHDVVGEIANMIAGSAKEKINDGSLTLGLPTVVEGVDHHVRFTTDMGFSLLHFTTDVGTIQIELGMAS